MNRSVKWSLLSSWALVIASLCSAWLAHTAPTAAQTTISTADAARDKAILASLRSATTSCVVRSDAPHPRLIPLSAQLRRRIISLLCFAPSTCYPFTFPTPTGATKKDVTFYFNTPKGRSLVNLDLNGNLDFYGDSPQKGKTTIAILCPESGRALRDLLLQEPSMKEIISPH